MENSAKQEQEQQPSPMDYSPDTQKSLTQGTIQAKFSRLVWSIIIQGFEDFLITAEKKRKEKKRKGAVQ